jgi:hypothetical protein
MQSLEFEVGEDGKTVSIIVRQPSPAIREQGERVYRRARQKAISAGSPTRKKFLERIDAMWGPAEQAKHEELCVAMVVDEELLAHGKLSPEERLVVAERLRQSRAERKQLFAAVNELELQTAEAAALQAEFDFLVTSCTYHRSGGKYFTDVDTYLAMREQGHPVAHKAYWALAGELFGLREDYEATLPENRPDSLSC